MTQLTLTNPPTPHQDVHLSLVRKAIPAWLGTASPSRRAALKDTAPSLPAWYTGLNRQQHAQLRQLVSEAWTAQNALDRVMMPLKSAEDFAAEVLQPALKQRFGVERDVRTTFLRLYVPTSLGAATTWTVSLLDAALHNFEASETTAGAYEPHSTFITKPAARGHFETLPSVATRLTVPQFTRLCRELDIGGQYHTYLREYLALDNPVSLATLKRKQERCEFAQLKVAAQMARLSGDVSELQFQQVQTLLTTPQDCKVLLSYDLSIMSSALTGIILFAAADLERSSTTVPVIAYIPDDPQQPLKAYASTQAFMQALSDALREPEYQQFFSRFVNHGERGYFFADLSQRLSHVIWHQRLATDPRPSWRDAPIDNPRLQFSTTRITQPLFDHLYEIKLSKLFNDAQTRAVSTAGADQKARWERWRLIEKIGTAVLQIAALVAAPFIPPLGLAMLGYTAYQLLDETFEGILDWAMGLRAQAFGHLMSILEQAVELGLFAVGLPIASDLAREHLPAGVWAFIDRLTPVTSRDGQTRLWQPDLAPYAHDQPLPRQSQPDTQGLYHHNGQSLLALPERHYAVDIEPSAGRHALKHPSRADAYRPKLFGNGQGAWVTELDRPLTWDSTTLLRRLGPQADLFSDAQLEQIRHVSGVHDNALRHVYLAQKRPPPLLADTLKRFKIDRALHDFIQQISSEDPAVYGLADAQTQLLLLSNYGLWPETKTLRVINNDGATVWQVPGKPDASVAQIHEAQLKNGDLLKTIIEVLDEPERKILLEEEFGQPMISAQARSRTLRQRLARVAQEKRLSLFDSAYRGQELTTNLQLTTLIDAVPGLPLSAAQALQEIATAEELQEIDLGRIPQRLKELALWARQETRVARAYEGLYLNSVDNLDTDRLALDSLENLPNWPEGLRIEVRNDSADGTLRNAIGELSAPTRRTLVYSDSGGYTPLDNGVALSAKTDLYTALLQALPDSARNALNIHIAQGPLLRQSIALHALDRAVLRARLASDPLRKPTYDPKTMRLLGGMDGYGPAPASVAGQEPTLLERAQDLFPALRPEQLNHIVHSLDQTAGGALRALVALKSEYQQLDRDLSAWITATPSLARETATPHAAESVSQAKRARQQWAEEIKRAWRLETETDQYYEPPLINGQKLVLNGPISGNPPALAPYFNFISYLALEGDHSALHIDGFLTRFPNVRFLSVRNAALGALPEGLGAMPSLNELVLSDCNITLTAPEQAILASLTALRSVDLYNNPLGLTPNVEQLSNLRFLDLSNTGITELPNGLVQCPHLEVALLKDNRIHTLPAALFELPASVSHRFDLSGNPLSRPTLELVKNYYRRTGSYFEADAEPLDVALAKKLYPNFSKDDINRLIFGIAGNLEMGKIELVRLELDYLTLSGDLDTWAQAPGLTAQAQANRRAVQDTLQACWRRESPLDERSQSVIPTYELDLAAPIGEKLPTLATRFTDVTSLKLRGDAAPLQLDEFLQSFPNLERLSVTDAELGDLPSTIFLLPKLSSLTLQDCALELSPASIGALEQLTTLEYLDLSNNPLKLIPDVRRMPLLSWIKLNNTGLKEIPAALISPTRRQVINLSHNAITQTPAELFQLPADATSAFDLSGNPLSLTALQRIKTYCQATGEHFNADAPAAEHSRVKRLYPTFTPAEVDRFIFTLPGNMEGVTAEVTRLETEYARLIADLTTWALDVPQRHPVLDIALDDHTRAEEQIHRLAIKAQLEEGWRRESDADELNGGQEVTHKLVIDTPIIGALPDINARFEHISLLEMSGEGTTSNVEGLLQGFPKLKVLSLHRYTMGDIPAAILNQPHLITLSLTECAIRLTPHSANALSGMRTLEYLDLSENPLGITPTVSNLHNLNTLHLENTGINQPPAGVFSLPNLRTVDLSENLIEEIPSHILEVSPTWDYDSDLGGNPLSDASLNVLRQYYLQTGNDLGVEAASLDAGGQPLVPPPTTPVPMEE